MKSPVVDEPGIWDLYVKETDFDRFNAFPVVAPLLISLPVYVLCDSYSLLMVCTVLYRGLFYILQNKTKINTTVLVKRENDPIDIASLILFPWEILDPILKVKTTRWDICQCKLYEGEWETAGAACCFWASRKPAHEEGEIFWDAGEETKLWWERCSP